MARGSKNNFGDISRGPKHTNSWPQYVLRWLVHPTIRLASRKTSRALLPLSGQSRHRNLCDRAKGSYRILFPITLASSNAVPGL